jgi:hypothetical protein
MHPSEEFDLERDLPPESEDLVEDLGLGTLFGAMAQGDKFILTVARAAVLSCLSEPEEIQYRQEVLADLTAHPQLATEIYSLATEALEAHRKVTFWTLNITPESLRYYSVQSLELLLGYLVRLRRLARLGLFVVRLDPALPPGAGGQGRRPRRTVAPWCRPLWRGWVPCS